MKYKVGDKILIKSLDWYNKNKTKHGDVWFDNAVFTGGQSLYCGCELTIRSVEDDRYYVNENDYYWMDEMIERLVERNGKTYPYKIGDRVVLKGNNRSATITDLKYNSWGNLSYYIKIDGDRAISIDYPTELLLPYDDTIECKVEDKCPQDFIEKYCKLCGTQRCDRTKEYLDGCPNYNAYRCSKKEEETKSEPKFKVGDRIVTDTDMKGKIIEVVEEGWYRVEFEPHNEIPQPNGVIPEESMSLVEEKTPEFKVGDKITKGKTQLTILNIASDKYIVEDNFGECGILYFNTYDDWKLVKEETKPQHEDKLKLDSTKTVREYWSEYAKIFIEIYDDEPNECVFTHLWVVSEQRRKGYGKQALIQAEEIAKELGCHIAHLKVETDSWMHKWYLRCGYKWYKNAPDNYTWLTKNLTDIEKKPNYPKTYEECSAINGGNRFPLKIIGEFTKLINARNAYWRVAGREMGLGKSWEPDWNNQELPKYCIAGVEGQVKAAERYIVSTILAFPTTEMRDAFYECFKSEIEMCKELL